MTLKMLFHSKVFAFFLVLVKLYDLLDGGFLTLLRMIFDVIGTSIKTDTILVVLMCMRTQRTLSLAVTLVAHEIVGIANRLNISEPEYFKIRNEVFDETTINLFIVLLLHTFLCLGEKPIILGKFKLLSRLVNDCDEGLGDVVITDLVHLTQVIRCFDAPYETHLLDTTATTPVRLNICVFRARCYHLLRYFFVGCFCCFIVLYDSVITYLHLSILLSTALRPERVLFCYRSPDDDLYMLNSILHDFLLLYFKIFYFYIFTIKI